MKKRFLVWINIGGLGLVLSILSSPGIAAAAVHPVVKIDILTSAMGGEGYVMSFALSDIANKAHSWLRLRGIETTGIAENLKTLAKEPQRRPNSVIFANAGAVYQAKMGLPPYEGSYDTVRAIALFSPSRYFWVTINPNLKTPRDLVGKKVGIFPKGSPAIMEWEAMLKYGFGMNPKEINWIYLPLGSGIDSLSDGRLAATWAGASPPPMNTTVPQLQTLLPVRDVYFIGFSEETAKEARKNTGFPTYVAEVPSGTYSPKQAKFYGHIQHMSWWADLSMDNEIVYEITKTIYENLDKFGNYHALGKTMTKASLAQIGVEEMFHPGAIKFYKEKGIKIGME
jgi:TRAP transporter TAXI family solute receptor